MRVLVCSDAVGGLTSLEAGRAIAAGWSDAQTTVVPVGEAGAGFLQATADRLGAELRPAVIGDRLVTLAQARSVTALAIPGPGVQAGPIPYDASSRPLGEALAATLGPSRPGTLLVDLVSDDVHDGGAGLLAGLGAMADVPLDLGVAGLTGLSSLDLAGAARQLEGVEVVAVVPSGQRDQLLLGLRGITSVRGHAAGDDPGRMLAADAALARLAELCGVADQPGAGACGGTAMAALALGGRVTTGPALALASVPSVDLVVTGCTAFDFAARGGGVVAAAAAVAERLLAPCVVLAGEVVIGSREMRTLGVTGAYPVRSSPGDGPEAAQVPAEELAALARRVAVSWRW